MRILHVISSAGFYGAERVVLDLINLSKQNGHAASLLCIKNAGKSESQLHNIAVTKKLNSKLVNCRSRFDIMAILKIKKMIKQEKIDLIHSHGYKANFYCLIAAWLSNIPVISTFHGWTWTGADSKLWFYEQLDKWVAKHLNMLISVSPSIVEELVKRGVKKEKIKLIYNGIDTDYFNPENNIVDLREEMGIKKKFVIGIVGRLSKEKGHSCLLKAFKNISSIIPEAKLLIVGTGPLRENLENEAEELSIADKVIFFGDRQDMPVVYKTMDVLVLPSLTEGLPLTLLEAMSMRLPVIASCVGAIPLVLDQESGFLVAPGNNRDLQKTLFYLHENINVRKALGEKAREKILSCFSLQETYRKYLEVYKEVNAYA